MVVYVVVTSFLRNVAFLIYALFGEISILEIPVVGNFSLFAGLFQVSNRPAKRENFPTTGISRIEISPKRT